MLRALIALLLIVCSAAEARAAVALVPAEDGSVGAWLLAGPLGKERCDSLEVPLESLTKGEKLAGSPLRVVSARRGALDLAALLGAGKTRGPCAIAAAVLAVERDFDGWLLISADGATDVLVDGRLVFGQRDKQLRGSSWDALRVKLGAGRHSLVLRLRHPGEHWAFAARLLDAADLAPPRAVSWTLPGTEPTDSARLTQDLATVELEPGLGASGWRPRLSIRFDNGVPRGASIPLAVEIGSGKDTLPSLPLGQIAIGARAVHRFEAQLPPVAEQGDAIVRVTARVSLGGEKLERTFAAAPRAPALVARAQALAEQVPARGFRDPSAIAATLSWRIERLRDARSEPRLRRALERLELFVQAVESGSDPLSKPGILSVAQRTALDGEPEPMTIQIPASFGKDTARRYPLTVVLHGYNGTPSSVLRAFFDVDRLTTPRLDGFVLAPNAFGNAFYRGPGEHEVLRAIDWALATYPIDPDRVSITGVSMGGTGSAFIALRHADRFAAASPLCGYHSYFVRRDTAKRPVRPWETARMHHWSPASWAENGRNLPLWVAHGTKDHPLENSKVLIGRYQKLGYSVTDEWPEIGHSVWEKTWTGARTWPWLSSQKRDPEPSRVTLKSDALATGKNAWLRLLRLAQPGTRAELDAVIEDSTHVTVTTEHVSSFQITRTSRLARDRSVVVTVDGRALSFEPAEAIALRREGDAWQKGAREPGAGEKRAGSEGPIREVFDGPLVFVWGSGDPRTARANRELAEAFARTRHGPRIHYPVVADTELDPALKQTHALFLVGTERDHRLLAELGPKHPIRVREGALHAGERVHRGSGVGAIFVHPNPHAPAKSLVVVTGTDAAGIWRALSLPQLLPDFLVYDAALGPASAEQILSAGQVLSGGFFDARWQLPADAEKAP